MTTFAATVTRSDLGLADLNINDGTNFRVSNEILGGTVTYDRNVISSPYVNGDITVHRRRANVQERFAIYVYGSTQAVLRANVKTLIDAFSQDTFNVTITLDSDPNTYQCEASDYTVEWSNAHIFAKQVRVMFNLNRKPIPLAGF